MGCSGACIGGPSVNVFLDCQWWDVGRLTTDGHLVGYKWACVDELLLGALQDGA
jgi:hypothetical protein